MLKWIVSSSLRLRAVMLALAAVLLLGGVWRTRSLPVDIVPEFSRPALEVQTEALGLSTPEVESLITVPLEADLLNGVPWLQSIESESITGLSSIEMYFAPGTDLMQARQMVQERLTQAHALPNVSSPPVLLQPVSSASRIMNIGLSSQTMSLIEMSVQARWNIVPRLVGVPGVANVSVWGHRDRQVQVQVDPARLQAKGITLEQIVKTAGESVWASPLTYLNSSTPGAGGFIDTPNQRLGVRHISPTSSPDTFAKVPVYGTALALNEVATVVEANQPLIGDALLKDGTGLMLVVEKFPGANTTQVTEGVEAALRELSPGMKGIEVDTRIYRPMSFIERATKNLTAGVVSSYLLIVLGLWALMGSWRTALVSALVIPSSVLAAIWVFTARGGNIDMMIIAGLMLAVAVIVDDSIVDIEHIVHRLRQARADGSNESSLALITRSVIEVRGPMLYATAIVVMAALPVVFMQGLAAPFFKPLFWSFIVAVLASFAVALTLTPTLAFVLLAAAPLPERAGSALLERIQRASSRLLDATLRTPLPPLALAVAGVAIGVLTWRVSEHSWLPNFKETDIVVEWRGPPGTSLDAMNRSTAAVMKELRAVKGVQNAAAHVGRAVFSKNHADVNSAEIWVSLDPRQDYEDAIDAIQAVLDQHPGVNGDVSTFLTKRMKEVLTGDDESLTVRVYGHDQEIVRAKAEEVRALMSKVDGVVNPRVETLDDKTAIEVMVDLDKARAYGLKPGDVRRAASTLVSGIKVGALFQDQKVFDVVVLGKPEVRTTVNDIRKLLIDAPAGKQVALADVADVRTVSAKDVIRRQGVSRRIDVSAEVPDGRVAEASREVAARIKDLSFPFEYHAQVIGEHVAQHQALASLYNYFAAAAVVIFLVVQAALGSWRLALLAIAGAPVAMLGGFAAVLLGGANFELGSQLGFLAVLALAVRHGIGLVRHFQALELQGESFGEALVERGVRERFPAIVTSALVTVLAVLPFVVIGDVAGFEIVHSAGVVVLGGMVSVLLLTLLCVPVTYVRFGARTAQDTLGLAPESAAWVAAPVNQPERV
jgi:Cu/Ag efflux pump CusA